MKLRIQPKEQQELTGLRRSHTPSDLTQQCGIGWNSFCAYINNRRAARFRCPKWVGVRVDKTWQEDALLQVDALMVLPQEPLGLSLRPNKNYLSIANSHSFR